jgi:hypothetical protein
MPRRGGEALRIRRSSVTLASAMRFFARAPGGSPMKRVAFLLTAILSPVLVASAQDAYFDILSEGVIATTYTEGGITFSNLENDIGGPIGTNSFICEQADADLTGQPGFSAPNCLGGATGYSPGPGAAYSRVKSYEMSTGQINTLGRLELWDGGIAGNTVSLEAYLGGTLVNSHTIVTTFAFGAHYTLQVTGVPFDMLRLQGGGPQENGCMFVLVDNVHISGSPTTGVVTCPGDGTGTACPCGNNSPIGAGEGCLSSMGVGGKLHATGNASLSGDTAVLHGAQMPNAPCLYFQGTTQIGGGAGTAFGDGLRCAGGTIIRLGTKTNVAGASQYPDAGDPTLSVRGQVTAPGLRIYQTWYRNAAAFCTPSTFNLTNSVALTWLP